MAARSAKSNHRGGVFKQNNKAHKSGRHKTKGELNGERKGISGEAC